MEADKQVLVIGGGVAGIQSSLDLAEQGYIVYLVEKKPSIGGRMAQLDKTFPTNDCSTCILAPKMAEVARHPNIRLLTYSEIQEVKPINEGSSFRVKILKKPRYVKEEKCTGCGDCWVVCPIQVPSEFDLGLKMRNAVYVPFPQAVPNVATIDMEHCIECKSCVRACKIKAIDFDQKPSQLELEVASVIVATGFDILDPSVLPQYGYKVYPNVLTALEFERLLSASGPTNGKILRPSDGNKPKKVAFIQCVGSRNENFKPYCSRICCMYATKEAMITKEHDPDVDVYIFYNDLRALGKGFQEYVNRAVNEYMINYVKGIPGEVHKDKDGSLIVQYENTLSGEIKSLCVDLVVLCPAIVPRSDYEELSQLLEINTDDFGFFKSPNTSSPVDTTVQGIYTCGVCTGPKDIPTSIAQASGAAARAATHAKPVKVRRKRVVEKPSSVYKEKRIGVFVCNCGVNIGSIVNVPEVVEYAKKLPDVIHAEERLFACSSASQAAIKEAIEKYSLNRIVVASCTPRTLEPLFRETCEKSGLNQYVFEMANIREQCSWVHSNEPRKATQKAKDLLRMAIARARLLEPQERVETQVLPAALVIGGGISGMSAAKIIADMGFKTFLIERDKEVGGVLRGTYKLFYKDDDSTEVLEPIVRAVKEHKNIELLTLTEVVDVSGSIGNFEVKLVNDGKEKTIHVGTIIVATGAEELKPYRLYGYGKLNHVCTQLELEQLLKDKSLRDGETMVMILCVGAREEKGRTYCSEVCCPEALKNAKMVKQNYPNTKIYILYRDLRVQGEGEVYYQETQLKYGVKFVRYSPDKPPKVSEARNGKLNVLVYDTLLRTYLKIPADRIVLATPEVPPGGNKKLSEILKVPLDIHGFFLEAHVKHRPVDFVTDGIYLCGSASSPKTVEDCISQAYAAASRALIPLQRSMVESAAIIAEVNEDLCVGCGVCKLTCDFRAIDITETEEGLKSEINSALCKGCGACAAACPVGAIRMRHFTDEQIISMIRAALEGPPTPKPRIVAFLCNWCSYAGADMAGVSRFQYPSTIRTIRLMCTGRIDISFILEAFRCGADGVLVCGCHPGDCHYITGNIKAERRIEFAKHLLRMAGFNPKRLRIEWVSASEGKKFADIVKNFTEELLELGMSPLGKATFY